MDSNIVFNVESKKGSGTGSARALRNANKIPAILYGGKEQVMMAVDSKEFLQEYNKGNINSKIVSISLDNKVIKAITRDIQLHPITDLPIHIDFQEVIEGTPIKVSVRVKAINSDKCPGIKKGGVLTIVRRSIPFRCDPTYIPRSIEIDVSSLEIGKSIHINDLQLNEKLSPVDKSNFPILSLSGRIEESKNSSEANEGK